MARVMMILILLTLAACATTEQRCVKKASYDLRTVDALIAETEASIARGFTYATEPSPFNGGWGFCTGGGGGRYGGGMLMCTNTANQTVQVPVAVDVDEQKRKLASLKAKRAELQQSTSSAVQACQIAAPVSGKP